MKPVAPLSRTLPLALVLACAPSGGASAQGREGGRASELAVQSRIVAPCCWNQTLENHASPLADALRAEIHTRVLRGETAEAIEDDLAARYGERVRAMPQSAEPRPYLAAFVLMAMGLGLAGLVRWGRRHAPAPAPATPRVDDAYDTALADELARLD